MSKNSPLAIIPIETHPEKNDSVQDFNSNAYLTEHDNNDYNPFEQRNVDKPNTNLGAFFHVLKCALGTGILAMPYAFSNGGLLFGPIMVFIIGGMSLHCAYVLVATSQRICKISRSPSLMYSQTAEKVFEFGPQWARSYSRAARNLVDYTLAAGTLTTGSIYIVFIASTFRGICNYNFGWDLSVRLYILMVMVPIVLLGQIRHLKYLTPFSGAGNAFIITVLGIVLYYIFRDDRGWDGPAIVSYKHWPIFISTVVYAFDGISIVMPVENSMKKPQQLLGKPFILALAFILLAVFYSISGFFGFARFGFNVEGSITLNLPDDEWTAITAQALIGVTIFSNFLLMFYVAMEIVFKKIEHRIAKSRNVSEIVIRTCILIVLGALGLAIPDVGIFIGLVGGFFSVSLCFAIPVCIETVFLQSQNDFGKFRWRLWKNIFIMLFSITAIVTATYLSVIDVIDFYK